MSKLNIGKDLYLKGRIGWQGLSKDEYLTDGDYKIINATALIDGYVDWENCGYITKERFEEAKDIQLKENDILISKDGTLGKIGYVKDLTTPCSVASGVFVLRNTKPELVDFDYLYHILKSHIFKDFINRNKALGSTISHLYQRDLNNFELELPSLEEQKRVAKVLNDIDSKIENNNKIVSELESLAKTIYDYWFLQFEFPNEDGKPYKSSGGKMVWNEELKREIPEGWKADKLCSQYEAQSGYAFKSKDWKEKGKSVLTIKCIKENGNINFSESSYIEKNYDKKLDKYAANNGNLIFAMSGNTIGKTGIIACKDGKVLINQRVLILKTSFNDVAFTYFFLKCEEVQNIIRKLGANSAQPNISETELGNIKLAIPNNDLIKIFNRKCEYYFKTIINLRIQNHQLVELRDWLLPMLMNGQVTFKEANE